MSFKLCYIDLILRLFLRCGDDWRFFKVFCVLDNFMNNYVGAELGVLGLLLWGSLVFGGMFTIHRMHRKLPSDWRVGDQEQRFLYSLTAALPIALAGFAVASFFLSFSYKDPIYILSAMVCGIYLTLPKRLAAVQHSRPVSRGRRRKVAPGVASAGQIAVQRGRPH